MSHIGPAKPPATLTAATFNVWTGQHGGGLRRNLRKMAKAARHPEVAALQEAHGLKRGFLRYRRIAADGFTRKEADQCQLLVHRKIEVVHKIVLPIDAPDWFGSKHGLRHPARVFVGAVLEKDAFRWAVLCIHRATESGGRNEKTRVAEVEQIAEWVHGYQERHPNHPIVLIGDWNGVPNAIVRAVDGKLALRGIDGALTVGATVSSVRELDRKFGSDNHRPVVLTLTAN